MADISKRLDSIDALRGFDMLFIMGFASLVVSICSLFPGGDQSWLANQMHHVAWNGLAHHDTIFPLFLFISGMTFPFSMGRKVEAGVSKGKIWLDVLRRGLVLVLLGLVYSGLFNLKFATLRWPSVLGRIGLAWMFAAMIFLAVRKTAWRAVIAAALLIGYWVLHMFVAPGAAPGTDPVTVEGSWAAYIDRLLMPNHLYIAGKFDPEGLVSTLPAIVTAMLGMFTGEFIRLPESRMSGGRKTVLMLLAAVVFLVIGLLWNKVFPINKQLWTSSFVMVMAAYSLAMFALFYYIMDVRGWKKWAFPLRVVGLNSITIYLAQRIIDFGKINNFFFKGLSGVVPEAWGSVILTAGYVLVCWLFLYFLYKKGVFLKV
ncbi:MAG: DUF5009 domain-containing protein [Bacteroidales bacterium]|nr:DUF5009 domain-containing protein [Bacteroidales bacterium]